MCKFMSEIQFLIGRRRPMRNYSPGALATIALWKSAPMHAWDIMPLGNIRKHKHCNCLKVQHTNNALFCFSLYNSLTIIVHIPPIVLLIINFASDVHVSMFEYLAVKIRFLPV